MVRRTVAHRSSRDPDYEAHIEDALDALRAGKYKSCYAAAKDFNLAPSTLLSRAKKRSMLNGQGATLTSTSHRTDHALIIRKWCAEAVKSGRPLNASLLQARCIAELGIHLDPAEIDHAICLYSTPQALGSLNHASVASLQPFPHRTTAPLAAVSSTQPKPSVTTSFLYTAEDLGEPEKPPSSLDDRFSSIRRWLAHVEEATRPVAREAIPAIPLATPAGGPAQTFLAGRSPPPYKSTQAAPSYDQIYCTYKTPPPSDPTYIAPEIQYPTPIAPITFLLDPNSEITSAHSITPPNQAAERTYKRLLEEYTSLIDSRMNIRTTSKSQYSLVEKTNWRLAEIKQGLDDLQRQLWPTIQSH